MMFSAIWLTFVETNPLIVSTLPFAMPGTSNLGFFVRMNLPFVGDWLTIFRVYGPSPGGGLFVRFLAGDFAAGVTPTDVSATANRNWLSGTVRLTVMSPVLSSVTMPGRGSLSFLTLSSPTISPKNGEYGPARIVIRLIVLAKSLAFTGVPSE